MLVQRAGWDWWAVDVGRPRALSCRHALKWWSSRRRPQSRHFHCTVQVVFGCAWSCVAPTCSEIPWLRVHDWPEGVHQECEKWKTVRWQLLPLSVLWSFYLHLALGQWLCTCVLLCTAFRSLWPGSCCHRMWPDSGSPMSSLRHTLGSTSMRRAPNSPSSKTFP